MIRRIVVEKTKVVIVLPTPHRTHYAGFGRIPEDETVTVVVNDEQPMLPAISPFIAQRDRLADSAQIGFIVADPTQDPNWNDATSVQQALESIDQFFEGAGLILQNEILARRKCRERLG
jgi:hypothetical protein